MRKHVIFTLIIALFAGLGSLKSQNEKTSEKKFALLVSAEDHVKMASKTAKSLFSDSKYNAAAFEVIICGKAVETVRGEVEWNKILQEGKKMGIVYKVCGISLEKFKIDEKTIPKEVEIVPNGILRMYDLKEQGYNTVEL